MENTRKSGDVTMKSGSVTMISDGGDPLPGCPDNFDQADTWVNRQNQNKDKYMEPIWFFDCSFKLDFDGPLLKISSRFYPPRFHYGPKWDGAVTIYLMGKEILQKEFECDTLEQLKDDVEKYIKTLTAQISLLMGQLEEKDHG